MQNGLLSRKNYEEKLTKKRASMPKRMKFSLGPELVLLAIIYSMLTWTKRLISMLSLVIWKKSTTGITHRKSRKKPQS